MLLNCSRPADRRSVLAQFNGIYTVPLCCR